MPYRIVFTPEAEAQIVALYRHVAHAASPDIAHHFTNAIVAQCEALDTFPQRGSPRDDLRPGIRTLAFRRSVTIAYTVEPGVVVILGIFYGGQDFEAILTSET